MEEEKNTPRSPANSPKEESKDVIQLVEIENEVIPSAPASKPATTRKVSTKKSVGKIPSESKEPSPAKISASPSKQAN